MTLPSTYKFKQALVKAPGPWLLALSGQGLPWPCPGLPLVKDLHCLGVTPSPHMFKLVQLGSHCTGTPRHIQTCSTWTSLYRDPLDIFKLVHYEPCTVYKWAVGISLECFLVVVFFNCNSLFTAMIRDVILFNEILEKVKEKSRITGIFYLT